MKSHRLNPILHKQCNAVDLSLPTALLGTDIGFTQALLGYNTTKTTRAHSYFSPNIKTY